MSHQEISRIEYMNICEEIFSEAEMRLSEATSALDAVEAGSSTLLDDEFKKVIASIRNDIEYASGRIGHERASSSRANANSVSRAQAIMSKANEVSLRTAAVRTAVREAFDSRMASSNADSRIESIHDEKVRTMARLLSRNKAHADLAFEDLVYLAESMVDPSKKVHPRLTSDVRREARTLMEKGNVSDKIIEGVVGTDSDASPLEIMDAATMEILDEKLRRSAIKAIVRSITARGFIVDKSNIRHISETDTVTILAQKPGGQRAEFSVDLRGRFMYHFQGYEGSACEKDIGPLERDLEKVYGMKLTDRKTVWRNPDRIGTKHHMEAGTRRM